MINAALPLYVWERREDGGEPHSISILAVLLQESALSLCRCSAAFQITEKTHQTLHFGFKPSRAVCCFLMKPVYAFMESVLVSVRVVSSSISCVDSRHLSNLSVSRRLFYRYCLFCFVGRESQTVSDLTGESEFKTHHVFKSFMLCQAAKSFWGHYLGQSRQGCCTHSTWKSHWADGATLDTSPTVQSYNLKASRAICRFSHVIYLLFRETHCEKKSLSYLILSCDPDQMEWKKNPNWGRIYYNLKKKKKLPLKFNLLYISLIILFFI